MSTNVGKELRDAREKKELSLNDVSNELHIRLTYLQAIENGRAEILPSVVQGRGFVRMYADFLGLDVEELLNSWDQPQFAEPIAKNNPALPPIESTQPRKSQRNQARAKSIQTSSYQSEKNEAPKAPAQIINPAISTAVPPASTNVAPVNNFPQMPTQAPQQAIPAQGPPQVSPSAVQQDPIREIFRSIGSALKQRREALCFSLEDCESQTLIRSNYVELMESGDFDQLPSYIQGRGMLNNYAVFLNLDVDKLMLQFADALQLMSQEKARAALAASSKSHEKPRKPTKKVGKLRQFLTPDLFVGVIVILGMAGIIIYSAVTISAYKRIPSTATPDLFENFIAQHVEATEGADYIPTATATIDPNTLLQNSLANLTDQNNTEEEGERRPVQIFISADQRTYLKVLTDGKEAFSGRTLPNNTYPFDAENLIEITTGNAGALSIIYNQQNLGKIGDIGQVLSMDFSPAFAATPTPRFSPTPTSTFVPTYTQLPPTPFPTLTNTPYLP